VLFPGLAHTDDVIDAIGEAFTAAALEAAGDRSRMTAPGLR
jgi:hypothetical protein